MELNATQLREHDKWAIAYHPDGDGFGTVNIVMNHLPHASFQLYSVDNAMRDFAPTQYQQLIQNIHDGYRVLYLDLTPSNVSQLRDILDQTSLFYIDHHQISPGFQELLPHTYAHNPRIFDPNNANAYAAGLQVYQLFGERQDDLPYLFISLFGDAKFEHWPQFHSQYPTYHETVASIADAISSVGLTKPTGPYNPARTDALFEATIQLVRTPQLSHPFENLIQQYQASPIASEYQNIQKKIQHHFELVKEAIALQTRLIPVLDDEYILSPILLKEAYKLLDFQGPFILYQVDQRADIVQYAVMSKQSSYDCAKTIRESPFVNGGGHTDRAGCTGSIPQLQNALDFFLQAHSLP